MAFAYFFAAAQRLGETPVEYVGELIAAASLEALAIAMSAAFDSPEAFERAYRDDSCAALDAIDLHL